MWTHENRSNQIGRVFVIQAIRPDADRALAKPFVSVAKYAALTREARLREILDSAFYVLTTGCPWLQLSKDFPPRSTAHEWFVRSHGSRAC